MTAEGDLVLGLDERQVVLLCIAVVVVVDVYLDHICFSVKEQHLKSEFTQPMPRTYEVLKRVGNYRLRRDGALVRLDEVGLAELVLADDDAVAGQRVVGQAARGRQHVPVTLAVNTITLDDTAGINTTLFPNC